MGLLTPTSYLYNYSFTSFEWMLFTMLLDHCQYLFSGHTIVMLPLPFCVIERITADIVYEFPGNVPR